MTAQQQPPDDRAALALSAAASHTSSALDALLAVSPLALDAEERAHLDSARAHAGALARALEVRRVARVVELRGPAGPAVRGPG